jgi:hypothetical protein
MIRRQECKTSGTYGPQSREKTHIIVGKFEKKAPLKIQIYGLEFQTILIRLHDGSINRAGLEDATNTKPHGNQRLHVHWWKAPDDGHNSVRNM